MSDAFLSLFAAVNNHGDLSVKLSSLKQAKDNLLTLEPSSVAEILPYLVELQSSPETLVRKYLIEVIDEVGANALEHLSILLPILLTLLKDDNPIVSQQSIITGTKFFSKILEELSFQFQQRGVVERWLEQLWTLMIKFSDAVLHIFFEADAVGQKLLAVKFLETCVLHFSLNPNDSERRPREIMARQGKGFNLSWISDGHPVLDPASLASDANRYLGILLDMLRSPSHFTGSLTISAINSVAAIARKRPVYYKSILNALLEFDPNFETIKASHMPSIQYSLRTAFLGFLRCIHPIVVESRERLLKVLRSLNAGDAAEQVTRQQDKIMRHNERVRELRMIKDDQLSNQVHTSGDVVRKRPAPSVNEDQNNISDINSKKARFSPHDNTTASINDSGPGHENGTSLNPPVLDMELTPVEQMISLIAALIAEGERGVKSLEVLVSNMHPDVLADIVIANMKHLPKNLPPLSGQDNLTLNHSGDDDSSDPVQAAVSNGFATSAHRLSIAVEVPVSDAYMTSLSSSEVSPSPNHSTDSKRDPRRDPRRLDPRRVVVPVDVPATTILEENINPHHSAQSDDANRSSSPPLPPLLQSSFQSISPMPKTETGLNISESSVTAADDYQPILEDEIPELQAKEFMPDTETNNASLLSPSSVGRGNLTFTQSPITVAMSGEAYSPSSQETSQDHADFSNVESSDVVSSDLPTVLPFIELDDEHQRNVRKEALERIINLYQSLQKTECKQTQMTLVARLFGQTHMDDVVGLVRKHIVSDYEQQKTHMDDVVGLVRKHIVSDYEQQKGHELAMHILYHLRTLVISDSSSSAASVYDDFLLGMAKSLLDVLPPSDKAFSRLLGDAPHIPDSILRLLEDICTENHSGIDGDRVTQGLGAVWSLILGRPLNRQACLDIALKCAVHPKDDVRVKAIRLVANKLYGNSHISENIERFATEKFLSCVVPRSDSMPAQALASESRIAGQVESQETSISGSQVSEPGVSQNGGVNDSSVTLSEALSRISLFFALCIKKESLLLLVFENYAHAPKAVKQAVHRHIPTLIRALGSSCSELLNILSNPPVGSEQLVIQVLNVLCEGTMPTPELIANVKNLYKTRLKDATILIPILSAFSRDEVLPIFSQLVNLPLDKFQTALAHILMGSALTGPALTPVEVLVAIHDVSPERDGLPLKKITDACSACFEQRTVFTQSVLSKALNQMVERTPLPLLFMRTVIQAIDAFPTLVNCVMEILSKLVQRQIWRMPKLWVGFLKCISQTQPHSFSVLIQLPSQQLEGALNKYPNLRGPLSTFVNQSNAKASLPRSTLTVLGLASEEPINQSQPT